MDYFPDLHQCFPYREGNGRILSGYPEMWGRMRKELIFLQNLTGLLDCFMRKYSQVVRIFFNNIIVNLYLKGVLQ